MYQIKYMALLLTNILIFLTALFSSKIDENTEKNKIETKRMIIDTTPIDQGEIIVTSKMDGRNKIRITEGKSNVLYYDIENKSITIPLTFGSGNYSVMFYEFENEFRYKHRESINIKVKLADENEAFRHPSVIVNYKEGETDLQKIIQNTNGENAYKKTTKYITQHFGYDYVKARKIKKETEYTREWILPDIQYCLKNRIGICQDLAATTVALLREQGYYSKLVIGYADGEYHAWVETLIDDKNIRYDPTAEIFNVKVEKYKPSRYY